MVKYLCTMWETRGQSLGWEDLLEKGMATSSSTLAWRIPQSEEPGRLQSTGRKESDTTERVLMGFPGGSVVKNLPAIAGDPCLIPGWEDPLEKERATHSSILAWEIPWTRRSGGLQSMGLQRFGYGLETKQQPPSSEVDLGTGNSLFCGITSPRTYLLLASPVFFFLCWLCLCILIAWVPLHDLISKYCTQTHLFISLDSRGSYHRWVLCICSSLLLQLSSVSLLSLLQFIL